MPRREIGRLWFVCLPLLATAAYGQTPVVDCVVTNPATGNLVAYFGYQNNDNGPVTIPLGANNAVSGLQIYGQIPTSFGLNPEGHILFGVQFVSTASAAWTLNGETAIATSANVASPVCQVAVGTSLPAGYPLRCWNTGSQAGACTQAEDVDGDGFCTILDCTGPAGPIGAPGSTGAAGPQGLAGPAATAPPLRTYSASPGTASASISCGAGEFLVTGGGTCTVPNLAGAGRIAGSSPNSNGSGWSVSCNAGQATTIAVCSPVQQ